jgi:exosortase/archaeosortase family protein
MEIKQFKLPEQLAPYRGIIGFVVTLMLSNLLWKYNIVGDESNSITSTVSLWGCDISAPFNFMARNVADSCAYLLNAMGWRVTLDECNVIRHLNGHGVKIIWACSGLKQAYIFTCILLFSRGGWIKKITYIAVGLLVVYGFNIIRITFIAVMIQYHRDWFVFLHEYLTKYAFYAVIFALWVIWEEKIAVKKTGVK